MRADCSYINEPVLSVVLRDVSQLRHSVMTVSTSLRKGDLGANGIARDFLKKGLIVESARCLISPLVSIIIRKRWTNSEGCK